MWPKKRTAFLVIHGIGEQNPFETLDAFVSNFLNVLIKKNHGKTISIKHKIKQRDGWVENYVSLVKEDREDCPIDFYEYYWAYRMERKIAFKEIIDWLIKTSDGARKFYDENEEITKEYERKGESAFKKGKLKSRWYLKHLGWFLRLSTSSIISKVVSKIPYIGSIVKFLSPIAKLFISKAKKLFVDYIGDVAIYTTTDVKSKHYDIRKTILDDSVDEVKALINDKNYDEIVLVGHSLGSVIAFDTLNRVNHAMNTDGKIKDLAGKIKGLVTFGSPLDKIAFFFREHTKEEQYIRRQILAHFHGFKSLNLNLQENEMKVENPIKPYLDHVRWVNFWDPKDPVCGQLDFYKDVKNVQCDMGEKYGLSHTKYWSYEKMYVDICDQLFSQDVKEAKP